MTMSTLTMRRTHASSKFHHAAAAAYEQAADYHRKAAHHRDRGEHREADNIADSARMQAMTADAQAKAAKEHVRD
jgi:hypothetical protein